MMTSSHILWVGLKSQIIIQRLHFRLGDEETAKESLFARVLGTDLDFMGMKEWFQNLASQVVAENDPAF